MLIRTSIVDTLKLNTLSFSSIVEIGDSSYIQGFSRALAVQREKDLFFGNEGNFSAFPAFSKNPRFQAIDENFSMYQEHLHPIIKVKSVNIVGASAASIIHIGSSNHISMESKIVHLRQLLPKNGIENTPPIRGDSPTT